MFLGPPLPLSPSLPVGQLLAQARPSEVLGAWVRGYTRPLCLYRIPRGDNAGSSVLAGGDLGFLLTRCNRVVVREGERHVVLESETVIQWRALQVALATPYLPGLERLLALFPGLQPTTDGVLVSLRAQSPEEVLARCMTEGMQVTGSRVVYVGKAVDAAQADGLRFGLGAQTQIPSGPTHVVNGSYRAATVLTE